MNQPHYASNEELASRLIAWARSLTAEQKRAAREALGAWGHRVDASVSEASRAYADRIVRQLRERGYFRPN